MTEAALRRDRLLRRQANLDYLLERRTGFLRLFLKPGERVLEVGAGLGIVGQYVPGLDLVSTDVEPRDWHDAAADVMDLPYGAASFDAVVCLHVLHHVERPRRALEQMLRVLRPGGSLLMAEPHASLALRAVIRLTGHEYVDIGVDPLGERSCQTRQPSGNNAIGDLLFGDLARFRKAFPGLEVRHHRFVECLTFLNSGGVGYEAPYLPLPRPALAVLGRLDDLLARWPWLFPMSREIVFLKAAAG